MAKLTTVFFSSYDGLVKATEFEEAFARLTRARSAAIANARCIACERCERCSDSTFLRDCSNVARSHYCTSCSDSSECSHTSHSKRCVGCSHCERCEDCVRSAYLVRCVGCSNSNYCFGCVGLSGKDFHILNEPYERQAWFEKVGELRRELRL